MASTTSSTPDSVAVRFPGAGRRASPAVAARSAPAFRRSCRAAFPPRRSGGRARCRCARVHRQVAAPPRAGHVAPAFGAEVPGVVAWGGAGVIPHRHVVCALLHRQVRERRPRVMIVMKAAPCIRGAQHFMTGYAGQAFARAIPHDGAAARIEHESGNRKQFQQLARVAPDPSTGGKSIRCGTFCELFIGEPASGGVMIFALPFGIRRSVIF